LPTVLFPDLYNALRAHRALVILGTLACVLATFLVTNAQQKYYEAAAVVRIEPTDQDSNPNDQYEASQRLARTYAEVYQRGAVSQQISALLGGPASANARSPRILPEELVAQQVKDLDLLSVGALTTNPQRSAQIANVGWRALDRLSDRDRLILVTPATAPTSPASPNLRLNLALSLFAGLILSAGLALILHALRQPIPDAEGLERDFGQPVLATIPHLDFGRRPSSAAPRRPASADADASPVSPLAGSNGDSLLTRGRETRPADTARRS
jgi:capsular polysaccharide biosynthesis protein